MRFVGEPWWMEVETNPAYGGMTCGLNHSRYWHAQTMRREETRTWCFRNHGGGLPKGSPWKDTLLKWTDVRWILEKEDNETFLMKYCPATGGRPASWQIRQGNYITLGELFVFGAHRCFLEPRSGPEKPERQGNQPLAGNRCATLEAQEAPSGAGTQPLAWNATLAVIRRFR